MASAELRQVRRRIRSIQSTMKITRAMELIAASRIARAQVRVAASEPYITKMTEVIRNIAAASGGNLRHPLLERREVTTVGLAVVSSDRGLAGGYNSAIIRLAERALLDHRHQGREVRLYLVGRKAQSFFRYRREILIDEYEEGRVDAVEAYTTRYVSALTQTPVRWPLLPIEPPDMMTGADDATIIDYTFEPTPQEILGRLLPRYLEGSVFGVLLEASASEHAARRRAMKAATENADDLTGLLTRQANQARQAEITTEISEIVGGSEALSHG